MKSILFLPSCFIPSRFPAGSQSFLIYNMVSELHSISLLCFSIFLLWKFIQTVDQIWYHFENRHLLLFLLLLYCSGATMADNQSQNQLQNQHTSTFSITSEEYRIHTFFITVIAMVVPLFSQLLVGYNYPTWIRSMTMALTAKNKINFVDGTITKPNSSMLPGHVAMRWSYYQSWIMSQRKFSKYHLYWPSNRNVERSKE